MPEIAPPEQPCDIADALFERAAAEVRPSWAGLPAVADSFSAAAEAGGRGLPSVVLSDSLARSVEATRPERLAEESLELAGLKRPIGKIAWLGILACSLLVLLGLLSLLSRGVDVSRTAKVGQAGSERSSAESASTSGAASTTASANRAPVMPAVPTAAPEVTPPPPALGSSEASRQGPGLAPLGPLAGSASTSVTASVTAPAPQATAPAPDEKNATKAKAALVPAAAASSSEAASDGKKTRGEEKSPRAPSTSAAHTRSAKLDKVETKPTRPSSKPGPKGSGFVSINPY